MCNTSLYYIYIFFLELIYIELILIITIFTQKFTVYIYIYIIKSFDMEKMRKQNKENQ